MTPRQLLDAADDILVDPALCMRGCWQRACATLTRIALEQILDRYWRRTEPSVAGRPMRTQLLALPVVAGDDVAALARGAWNGLRAAVHHHTYELAPIAAELRGWHRDVRALLTRLDPPVQAEAAGG